MKRKRATVAPEETPVVPETLRNQAKLALNVDQIFRASRCIVCGDATPPGSNEGLCWVCRRLKVSAWRDSDSQMPAQE